MDFYKNTKPPRDRIVANDSEDSEKSSETLSPASVWRRPRAGLFTEKKRKKKLYSLDFLDSMAHRHAMLRPHMEVSTQVVYTQALSFYFPTHTG